MDIQIMVVEGDILYMPKIAIVIPSYIKADSPEDAVEVDGFRMLKRALGSLEILKEKEIEVVLPFCIEGKGMGKGMAQEYHFVLMKALANSFPFKRIALTAYNLNAIKDISHKMVFLILRET